MSGPNLAGLAHLGHAFRQRRLQLGLTQGQLARRAGCARTTVVHFELGRGASLRVVEELAVALGLALAIVDPDEPEAFHRPCSLSA